MTTKTAEPRGVLFEACRCLFGEGRANGLYTAVKKIVNHAADPAETEGALTLLEQAVATASEVYHNFGVQPKPDRGYGFWNCQGLAMITLERGKYGNLPSKFSACTRKFLTPAVLVLNQHLQTTPYMRHPDSAPTGFPTSKMLEGAIKAVNRFTHTQQNERRLALVTFLASQYFDIAVHKKPTPPVVVVAAAKVSSSSSSTSSDSKSVIKAGEGGHVDKHPKYPTDYKARLAIPTTSASEPFRPAAAAAGMVEAVRPKVAYGTSPTKPEAGSSEKDQTLKAEVKRGSSMESLAGMAGSLYHNTGRVINYRDAYDTIANLLTNRAGSSIDTLYRINNQVNCSRRYFSAVFRKRKDGRDDQKSGPFYWSSQTLVQAAAYAGSMIQMITHGTGGWFDTHALTATQKDSIVEFLGAVRDILEIANLRMLDPEDDYLASTDSRTIPEAVHVFLALSPISRGESNEFTGVDMFGSSLSADDQVKNPEEEFKAVVQSCEDVQRRVAMCAGEVYLTYHILRAFSYARSKSKEPLSMAELMTDPALEPSDLRSRFAHFVSEFTNVGKMTGLVANFIPPFPEVATRTLDIETCCAISPYQIYKSVMDRLCYSALMHVPYSLAVGTIVNISSRIHLRDLLNPGSANNSGVYKISDLARHLATASKDAWEILGSDGANLPTSRRPKRIHEGVVLPFIPHAEKEKQDQRVKVKLISNKKLAEVPENFSKGVLYTLARNIQEVQYIQSYWLYGRRFEVEKSIYVDNRLAFKLFVQNTKTNCETLLSNLNVLRAGVSETWKNVARGAGMALSKMKTQRSLDIFTRVCHGRADRAIGLLSKLSGKKISTDPPTIALSIMISACAPEILFGTPSNSHQPERATLWTPRRKVNLFNTAAANSLYQTSFDILVGRPLTHLLYKLH